MNKLGQDLSLKVTAPLVAIGTASVKMAMDLDESMRNIQSVGGQTEEELQALSDLFVDMSTDITKTTDSAQNLADAFYDIQGSGFEGADALKILEAATMAASAGLTETSVAAEGITAVLNSYGKTAEEAAHISDLMFMTVDRGVGSFEELTSSMSNVVGTSATLGVAFDETSAAIATMSKQGLSFSEATVSLNQVMLAFIKPSEEMAAAIADLGYESGESMIEALGLSGAMAALEEHTGGGATAMSGLFGNVRALRGALALTGEGASMFAEDLAAMSDSAGRTAEAFGVQTESFAAQWASFQNNLQAMAIEIGQIIIPVLNKLIQEFLIPAITWFRNLPQGVKEGIVMFAAFAAAAGPVMIVLSSLITAFTTIKAALLGLAPIMAGLSLPIVALIAAVGALAVALHFWEKTNTTEVWRTNFAMLGEIVEKGSAKIGKTLNESGNQWGKNFEMLGTILGKLRDKLPGIFANIITSVKQSMANMIPAFKEMGVNIMQGLIAGVTSMAAQLIQSVMKIAQQIADTVKSTLKIQSPSKIMMELGEYTAEGFHKGIQNMGGVGVSLPTLSQMSGAVASGGGGMGGAGTINIYPPPGTKEDMYHYVARKLAQDAKRRS